MVKPSLFYLHKSNHMEMRGLANITTEKKINSRK